jgi:hypothetical protein
VRGVFHLTQLTTGLKLPLEVPLDRWS